MSDLMWKKRELLNETLTTYVDRLQAAGITSHLDFGCGRGEVTSHIAAKNPHAQVTGYDRDHAMIARARSLYQSPNLLFTTRLYETITSLQDRVSSVSANFVLHDVEDPIRELNKLHFLTKKGGLLWIMEHNLKGCSLSEFEQLFCTENERLEIEQLTSLEEAYRAHTQYGVDDFTRMVEKVHFTPTEIWSNEFYCTLTCYK